MGITFKNSCDGAYDSLDVRFTKSCDNSCSFCIEKSGIASLGKTDVMKLYESTIKSGIKEVLILGGEPFLDVEKLDQYVALIRPHVNKIYITTSVPATFLSENAKVGRIISRIDGLNVSLQSTRNGQNNHLLAAISTHDRISVISQLCASFGDKIRVSLNLSTEGIDSFYSLVGSLEDLQRIGCTNIKVNELQHTSREYVSFNDMIGKDKRLKSPYAHGCQTPFRLAGVDFVVKRSCFLVEESQKATLADLFKVLIKIFYRKKNKFMVLYENGMLKNKWLKK